MLKKIKAILSGSEYITESKNGYAVIGKTEFGIDENGDVFGGKIVIRYGQDGFSPHSADEVEAGDVEHKMRDIEPDLRKWTWKGD